MPTKEWYIRNREYVRRKRREYYLANKEKSIRTSVEWARRNRKKTYESKRRGLDKINALKRECADCGSTDFLEFHHRNPEEKSGNVVTIYMRRGMRAAMEEVAKCDVLCVLCHYARHGRKAKTRTVECPACGEHFVPKRLYVDGRVLP